MKKRLLAICVLCMVLLCACKTSKSYTWSVVTGDNIKVTLDTSDGFDMTNGNPITFSIKDSEYQGAAIFMDADDWEARMQIIEGGNANVVKHEGDAYYFTETLENGVITYNYMTPVPGSSTYFLMSGYGDEQLFYKNVESLKFSKE